MALTQDIRVTFQLKQQASENVGSIKIEDLTNYTTGSYSAGQTVKVYFIVTNPNGQSVISGSAYGDHIDSTIQADGNVDDSHVFNSASLGAGGIVENVSDYVFISGEYSVQMFTKVNGADEYTYTETFTINYTRPSSQLTSKLNCTTAILNLIDLSDYSVTGATVTSTRSNKATYPAGVSNADISGSGKTIVMSDPLYTGVVRHSISTDVTYDFESSLSQKVKITDVVDGGATVEVACQFDGTDAEKCLDSLDKKYRSALSNNPVLADRLFKTLSRATQLLSLYEKARISDSTKAAQYFNEIKSITNCTEECSGCDKKGPQLVVPAGGSAASVSVNGSSSVTVTESPANTFTITANSANIIGSIEDNRVTSGNGIRTTSSTLSGVKTYSLNPDAVNSTLNSLITLVTGTTNNGASATKTSAQGFGSDFSSSITLVVENTDLDKNFTLNITGFFSASATADANYKTSVHLIGNTDDTPHIIEPVISTYTSSAIVVKFVDRRTGVILSRNGINEYFNEGSSSTLKLILKIDR